MTDSDFEKYYQKGGTYILPIEVFNELFGEMENWKEACKQKENIIKELKEDITFCINNMKNEYSCTDSRTNRELHTMVKILEESLDKGE